MEAYEAEDILDLIEDVDDPIEIDGGMAEIDDDLFQELRDKYLTAKRELVEHVKECAKIDDGEDEQD